MVQGYYTALERTMFLGHADQESLRSIGAHGRILLVKLNKLPFYKKPTLKEIPMSPRLPRYWEANVAVHRRGLELIKPGAKCR